MLPRIATAASLAAVLIATVPSAARAATITSFEIAATTTGCFGTSCSTFVDQPTFAPFSFDGTSFDVTTDQNGSASNIVLGTFSRDSGNFTTTEPFTLQVLFTVPIGVSGNPTTFAATFIGTGSGNKPTFINFDNSPRTFTFNNGTSSGSFIFTVFDIGSNSSSDSSGLDKNETVNLYGSITNAIDPPVGEAPEPATIVLLGSGLAWAAWRGRRRQG